MTRYAATVVVMGNAGDEIAVLSQALFGEIPGSLTTW